MKSMNVAVVGGGPAGLFLARLLRLRDPAGRVLVYERHSRDAAFGFGVVLSDRTMARLHAADPQTTERLAAASVSWDGMELWRGGEVVRYSGHGLSAISRKTLLGILQDQAAQSGADLRFGADVQTDAELSALVAGHDVVALAGGANCVLRDLHSGEFGTTAADGGGRYIWFGTTAPFDQVSFSFETHGSSVFAAHAYPYEPGLSTYIVTTDDDSWLAAGMDASTALSQRPGDSDYYSKLLMKRVFRDHLRGGALLVNNTKWTSFRVIRNRRLTLGSVVLLGDTAHTAHPSVGSGTKLAMEDALTLAEELTASDTVPAALAGYEQARRPVIARTQQLAQPSMRWWETYRSRMHLGLQQLGFHYLTRTTALGYAGLRRRDPAAVSEVERWYGAQSGTPGPSGALSRHAATVPGALDGAELRNRLVTILPAGDAPPAAEAARRSGLVILGAGADRARWRAAADAARGHGALIAGTVPAGDPAAAADAAAAGIPFLQVDLDPADAGAPGETALLLDRAAAAGLRGVTAAVPVPREPLGTSAAADFTGWCSAMTSAGILAFCLSTASLEPDEWEHLLGYADLIRAQFRVPVAVPAPADWTVPDGGFSDEDPWSARLHVALLSGRADLISKELRP